MVSQLLRRFAVLLAKRLKERLLLPSGVRNLFQNMIKPFVATMLAASVAPVLAFAEIARITVDTSADGIPVNPLMHGVFFEDINYGADGGLYAELLPNRSFENRDAMHAWSVVNQGGDGDVKISNFEPLNENNPQYARLTIRNAGDGYGIANSGYEGIPVTRGEKYLFAARVRANAGYDGELLVRLEDEKGTSLGYCRIKHLPDKWGKVEDSIIAAVTTTKARLVVVATKPGTVDLDVVSLFPEHTWNKRRNGLRADLVQMLADMKPGFLRFPGGCIVEGKDLANAYRWKETIGDIAERKQNWNRWQDAVDRKAPHYYQTYGLGFFEYFQLCEDIGAEPVPILNCGMSCQYQDKEFVPLDELDPWVQDALDLVEFANGPVTSEWGRKRAEMGHPEPFNLKLLGIGNEQWDEAYFDRYLVFYKALKAKYPEIILITTSGPGVDDRWWNLAWNKFKRGTPAEIVDEHYYRPPQWFLDHESRYDAYDRNGPKVFAGEFAAHDRGRRSNLRCAINEAAFMTGLLRNADVVHMAAYAPLFARAGFTQWEPDLIWLDATRVYGTPSYHVQKMFSVNRPDIVLPTEVAQPAADESEFAGRIGVGTWNTQAEFKDIQVTRNGQTLFASDFSEGTNGWSMSRGRWDVVDGALRQTAQQENVFALAGDPTWSDYTLTLKARKLAGGEGFLILFQTSDASRPTWWNLGGWGNTQHGLEFAGAAGERVSGSIETGRWYDVRVEVNGAEVKCHLDGKLVQQATRTRPKTLYAVAGRDAKSGEFIVDVVNVGSRPVETVIDLGPASGTLSDGRAWILTSDSLDDVNSFGRPMNVAPREERFEASGTALRRVLPPNSFAVLRVKTIK